MYTDIRPLMFRLDAERAHDLTLKLLRLSGRHRFTLVVLAALYRVDSPHLAVEAFGLRFKNRVGLAAGYDKNGSALQGLACLGFGHLEAGTLTCRSQEG